GGTRGLYRLPTEAEWEYAARSGGKREKYAGGDDVDSVAWYTSNSGSKTHQVGTKAPNGLGIYDMSGNVWEWVQDIYSNKAYSSHSRNNPIYTESGSIRVLRGGSWSNIAENVRAANRFDNNPDLRNLYLGFRLARTP
ncbi:MAG: formylglycine-generating enzyme family protein, partial [Nitrospirae bacterium]